MCQVFLQTGQKHPEASDRGLPTQTLGRRSQSLSHASGFGGFYLRMTEKYALNLYRRVKGISFPRGVRY